MSKVVILNDACTLILGDCLDVIPTLDNSIDHVISDPPYEQMMHAAKNKHRRLKKCHNGSQLKSLDFDSIDKIRAPYIASIEGRLSGWFINFCTVEGVAKWADAINQSNLKYKRACLADYPDVYSIDPCNQDNIYTAVWDKPDGTPQLNGQGPGMGFECFVAAWAGPGYASWNAGGKRGVYRHACNPPSRHGGHPTEKPLALMAELVRDFTSTSDLVLDPFMGSGTTGIACLLAGRRFIGIERDPKYFFMAVDRISKALQQPSLFTSVPPLTQQKLDLSGTP